MGFSVDVKSHVVTPALQSGVAWGLPHGIFKVWKKTPRQLLLGEPLFYSCLFLDPSPAQTCLLRPPVLVGWMWQPS